MTRTKQHQNIHHRHIYYRHNISKYLFVLFCSLLLTACPFKSSKSTKSIATEIVTPQPPVQVPPPPKTQMTKISILVIDQHYQTLSGVNVTLQNNNSSLSELSNENGQVSFEVDYANFSFPAQITTYKKGYSNQVKIINDLISQGDNQFQLAILERQIPISFNAEQAINLISQDGARLTMIANSLIDQQGNAVTGAVNVYITPLDIKRENALSLFPGEFLGTKLGNEPMPILTYGTTEFHFEQDGKELDLIDGMTAQIELPIYVANHPNGQAIVIGDSIDLWHLNENTGIWQNYQQGLVVHSKLSPSGLALQASVPHFSWWNTDVAALTTAVQFNITGDFSGQCKVKVSATAGSFDSPGRLASSLVDVPGSEFFILPVDNRLSFRASLNANGQVYYGEQTIAVSENTNQVNIALSAGNGNANIPLPYIASNRATVRKVFSIDSTDNTYIHENNKINYYWQVLAGEPQQSGCSNADDPDNNPDNISIVLTSDAKHYTEVSLGNNKGSLTMLVDPYEVIDQSGEIIAKDPDPISITLSAKNSFGTVSHSISVDNKGDAVPEILTVNLFTNDNFQSTNILWRVIGADEGNVEIWQGTDIDLNSLAASYPFSPDNDEIFTFPLIDTEQGAYIRVSFSNQYGVSYRDFVIGENFCDFNTDLPTCQPQ